MSHRINRLMVGFCSFLLQPTSNWRQLGREYLTQRASKTDPIWCPVRLPQSNQNVNYKKKTQIYNLGRVLDIDTCQLRSTANWIHLEKLHLLQVSNIFFANFWTKFAVKRGFTPIQSMKNYRLVGGHRRSVGGWWEVSGRSVGGRWDIGGMSVGGRWDIGGVSADRRARPKTVGADDTTDPPTDPHRHIGSSSVCTTPIFSLSFFYDIFTSKQEKIYTNFFIYNIKIYY